MLWKSSESSRQIEGKTNEMREETGNAWNLPAWEGGEEHQQSEGWMTSSETRKRWEERRMGSEPGIRRERKGSKDGIPSSKEEG